MEEFDLSNFWNNSKYTLETYVSDLPTDEMIISIEEELGYRLPGFYLKMMSVQNGGTPNNTCFPTEESTSWAENHIAITGIMGIGRTKTYSLCGPLGSKFMIEEWEYPEIGVCICDCPSGGHDMIMLDYRKNGKDGEPQVVHVDQESDYKITFLAENFESFVKGLVHQDVYDTSEEDLKQTLKALASGRYSTILQGFLNKEKGLAEQLRKLLIHLSKEKGYFALHADPLSYLVYDIQFYLYSKNHKVESEEEYFKVYPQMIAMTNHEISTGGYADGFMKDWMKQRISDQLIMKELSVGLKFHADYEAKILKEMSKFE